MEYSFEMVDRELARSRSSTWPLQDPAQLSLEAGENGHGPVTVKGEAPECESPVPCAHTQLQAPKSEPTKKMRNAWGNMFTRSSSPKPFCRLPKRDLHSLKYTTGLYRTCPTFQTKLAALLPLAGR